MATRLTCLALFLAVLGLSVSATSVRADSTNDFRVILNDPSCPSGAYCATIGLVGNGSETYTVSNPLTFIANPPLTIPPDQTAACGSDDESISCGVFAIPTSDPQTFLGVAFWGFSMGPGQQLTIGVLGTSLSLNLPSGYECDPASACPNGVITLTPEPSTILLLVSGLAFLVFFRRRLSTAIPA